MAQTTILERPITKTTAESSTTLFDVLFAELLATRSAYEAARVSRAPSGELADLGGRLHVIRAEIARVRG